MKALQKLKVVIRKVLHHGMYATLDGRDNSVTISKRLYGHITKHAPKGDRLNVFVFHSKEWNGYGFTVNAEGLTPEATTVTEIQYNEKHKTIGFASHCPSVCWMHMDFGLPTYAVSRHNVTPVKLKNGTIVYRIEI